MQLLDQDMAYSKLVIEYNKLFKKDRFYFMGLANKYFNDDELCTIKNVSEYKINLYEKVREAFEDFGKVEFNIKKLMS